MTSMINKRTLLTALSFAFVSACTRAQAVAQPEVKTADISGIPGQALRDLIGGPGKVVWLSLSGTVRLTKDNANVRPATLQRALMLTGDGTSAKIFDVWQVEGSPAIAAPSITRGQGRSETSPNDAGTDSLWLSRSFSHAALQAPVEHSRLAREGTRVMAIDATQIWLLDGGLAASAPSLAGDALTAFEAWRVS
jgi:hypothetical protein